MSNDSTKRAIVRINEGTLQLNQSCKSKAVFDSWFMPFRCFYTPANLSAFLGANIGMLFHISLTMSKQFVSAFNAP